MRTRIGAVLVVFLLAACEGETVEAPPATVEPSSPVPARTTAPTPAPSTAASLGTVPPAWLGQRQLPRTANGLGEIRPTPAELRDRRFTLPDHLEPLPGDGFASSVESVPNDVLAR